MHVISFKRAQGRFSFHLRAVQACHNVSVEKPEIFKKFQKRPFFKNADSACNNHLKKKGPDFVWFNHFSALDIAIIMIQEHFIKLTLNVHVYLSK